MRVGDKNQEVSRLAKIDLLVLTGPGVIGCAIDLDVRTLMVPVAPIDRCVQHYGRLNRHASLARAHGDQSGSIFVSDRSESVPRVGELLLRYVCPSDRLEEFISHLERNFVSHTKKYGVLSARRWFWFQVVRMIGKRVCRVAMFLAEFVKRLP